jgi:hypothetical protein
VLKKAGIVLTVSAAGLLAVSPLAFAGNFSDDGDHGHHGHHRDGGDDGDHDQGPDGPHVQYGLVNLQNNNVQVPVQACNNSILEGTLGILALGQSNSDSHDGKCVQHNASH